MSKVIEWIYNHRWAITPEALGAILEIADKKISSEVDPAIFHQDLPENVDVDLSKYISDGNAIRMQAVEAVEGEPLPGTRRAIQRGKVAIIPVRGPIFPRANIFTAWSGGTSVDMLSKDFKVALEDPSITSIIFNVDSPGGEITGISEFADMVFKAQGDKRILTYVSGMMASAGYWIGSATSEIISTNTGELGSIGVVVPFRDTSALDEKKGIKNIEIVSSVSPKKRFDIKTDDGKAIVQKIADELADIFVSAVATHRGTDVEDVIDNFGQGGMLIAQSAIDVGMADRIGSFEQLITEENSKPISLNTGGFQMKTLVIDATVDTVKAENPELYKAIQNIGKAEVTADVESATEAGFKSGVEHENARIQGIESLASADNADLVNEHKFNSEQTKESVALLIVDRDKAKTKKAGDDVTEDAKKAGEQAGEIDGSAEVSKEETAKRTASSIASGMNQARGIKAPKK